MRLRQIQRQKKKGRLSAGPLSSASRESTYCGTEADPSSPPSRKTSGALALGTSSLMTSNRHMSTRFGMTTVTGVGCARVGSVAHVVTSSVYEVLRQSISSGRAIWSSPADGVTLNTEPGLPLTICQS